MASAFQSLPEELYSIIFQLLDQNALLVISKTDKFLRTLVCRYAMGAGVPNEFFLEGIIRDGHLNVLQYVMHNITVWQHGLCYAAARCGQLHILKFLREKGCSWDGGVCSVAARNGHFDVLQWARPL